MPPAREAVDDRDRCGRRSPGAMPPTRNASAPSWRREAPTRSRRCGRTFLADIPCPPWRARARCHDSDGRPSANSPRGWAQSIGSRVAADLMWTRTRRGSGMPLRALVSVEGGPASRRFCSERCRKSAYRGRMRAERKPSERRKAATTSRRRSRPDPERVAAGNRRVRACVAAEAERSLRRDPSRWSRRRTTEVPDHGNRIGQDQGAKP